MQGYKEQFSVFVYLAIPACTVPILLMESKRMTMEKSNKYMS